jgi:nucleoside-diphosphate-sugar epimerase
MSIRIIVGCGYVGGHLARAEARQGHTIRAIVQTSASAARLAAAGWMASALDLDQPISIDTGWVHDAVIYYLVPPPAHGLTDPRLHHFLSALASSAYPARVVLLSTSGVYGDCDGAWVNEDRQPQPQADRARRRFDAEQQLRSWSSRTQVPIVILRVPGIYGPGRLPLKRLQAGEPVLREEESPWSNRVHVDDLVLALQAAAERGRSGAVYNVSDGHPTTMTDYFNRVADAAGLPRPPQIALSEAGARFSAGMQSYLAESKRLDIHRLREELGVELRYPDLTQGLAACLVESESHTKR